MMNDDLISIREAAVLSGRSKKLLQSLVEGGALPAVRRDDKWLISRTDLARLYQLRQEVPGAPEATTVTRPLPPPRKTEVGAAAPRIAPEQRADVTLLLELLRQRDEQVQHLQNERAHLSAQVGFLQGLLVEREARLRVMEAFPAVRALQTGEDPAAFGAAVADGSPHTTAGEPQPAVPDPAEEPETAPTQPAVVPAELEATQVPPREESSPAVFEPRPAPARTPVPADLHAAKAVPPSRRSSAVLLVRRLLSRRQ